MCLSFEIIQSTWRTPCMTEPPGPSVKSLEGTQTHEDDEGNESTLVWTPETGRWILRAERCNP